MGVPAVGAYTKLVVVKETTYGVTPGSPAGKVIGLNNFTLKKGGNQLYSPQLASDPNYRQPLSGRNTHEGGTQCVLNFDSLPLIQEWLTGNRATTGTTNYLHTSKISAGTPVSMAVEAELDINGTKHYVMHNGVLIQSFRVTAGGEGYVTADLGLAGKISTNGAASAFTTPTDLSEGTQLSHAMIGAADVQLAGAQFDGMVDMNLSIEPELNLNDYRANGQNTRHSVTRSKIKVSGTLNSMFDSLTLYNLVTAGNTVALSVKFTKDANTYWKITLPAIKFPPTDPIVNDPGPIPFSAEFAAGYDGTALTSLILETSNQKAGTVY